LTKTSAPSASETPRAPLRAGDITWQWVRFNELRLSELYEVVKLREGVFVVEQNCPYPDADGRDPNAWHLLGWVQDAAQRNLIAYARIFEPGIRYAEPSIGRIVTAPSVRGTGLGKALMVEALKRMESLAPGKRIKIAAQQRLEDFYTGFGFAAISDPYEEDGIMHVDMLR
jgi:ElaA protein